MPLPSPFPSILFLSVSIFFAARRDGGGGADFGTQRKEGVAVQASRGREAATALADVRRERMAVTTPTREGRGRRRCRRKEGGDGAWKEQGHRGSQAAVPTRHVEGAVALGDGAAAPAPALRGRMGRQLGERGRRRRRQLARGVGADARREETTRWL
uniref:DUF834 domain-containing protein n=1 Tax=Oryza glumipatula TaxID=40148 RepID=A0A0E0AIQ1_9ORYZ